MSKQNLGKAHFTLFLNTTAFTICFAVWMLNGVLITFLVEEGNYNWTPSQVGWLMGAPVLSGALFRLPAGILTDKYGGKPVMALLLLFGAIPLTLLYFADTYFIFLILSIGFGIVGSAFAVGIAYTSVWYPSNWQGTALGIFGAGNAGAAITTLLAPSILNAVTDGGNHIEGWRQLPLIYSVALIIMAVVYVMAATNKKTTNPSKSLSESLQPLKSLRVWRFGLYYFLVFGCFVAFAQWLVPYYVNLYSVSLVTAGLLASAFSFPSGVIRAFGGWLSDVLGARKVMYWVLGGSVIVSFLLIFPRMAVQTPGEGVLAERSGTVTQVTDEKIIVSGLEYKLSIKEQSFQLEGQDEFHLVWPTKETWHEPVVHEGDQVERNQLLASGHTQIYFQANIWIATTLIILIGIILGVGKAAVYKFIPDYFPNQVGVVGGIVGVIGGLGGFFGPIIFGYLIEWTGFWTSSWIFMLVLSGICLIWLHTTASKMMENEASQLFRRIEEKNEK